MNVFIGQFPEMIIKFLIKFNYIATWWSINYPNNLWSICAGYFYEQGFQIFGAMTKFRNPGRKSLFMYITITGDVIQSFIFIDTISFSYCYAVNFKSYWLISAKKLSKFEVFPSILLNRNENVLFVFEILLLADLKPLLSCNLQLLSISDMV